MEHDNRSRQSNVTAEPRVATSRRPDVVYPIESQEQLIQVSKTSLYDKIPKKWREYILLAIGISIAIFIISMTLFIALAKRESISVCTSPECIRSANNFLLSMDTSVKPCDDFYSFACNNWRHEHIMEGPRFLHNWFEERNRIIKRKILEFLEQEDSEDEPEPVHQARIVFDSCKDFSSINEYGLHTLWSLLEEIGLPKMPLLLNEPKQNWIRSEAKIRRYLGKEILIGFAVMTSLQNSTLNQLAIATADTTDMFLRWRWLDVKTETFLEKHLQKGSSDVIRLWKNFSSQLIKYFVDKTDEHGYVLESDINAASLRILQMKQNISQIENSEHVIGPFINDIPDDMELQELQELVDNSSASGVSKINWEVYFESLFEDVEELNFPDDRILVYKKEYFELLSEFLDVLSDKDLELLLWWEVVYTLAPHIHEDLKSLKDVYTAKVLSTPQGEPRDMECAMIVYNFMDSAVGYLAVTKSQPNIAGVSEMISNIQDAFIQSVYDLSWMDESTRIATIKKIRSIRKFIGLPEWMADSNELESLYNITVESTTHLENLLVIMDNQVVDSFLALRRLNNNSISQFKPLEINAYYDPSGNAISVPAGILEFPFYNLGLESLNYGAIGSVLGHELTHGLDSYGRKFDLNGNLNFWWTNASINEYEKRTSCFVDSYSSVRIPSINETIKGEVTLSENLADDGGLRNAYLAYLTYTSKNKAEQSLPGLEQYSNKQLFFLAYANIWCAEYTDESLSDVVNYDEHSPQFIRVNKAIENMLEFSEVWNCPVGSTMNPAKKCKLWLD